MNIINHLDFEFKLSRTNGSRVLEKGLGSTFEVSHALLSQRTSVQILLSTSKFQFSRTNISRVISMAVTTLQM